MFGFGATELLLILGLVLVVFGAGQVPKIGTSLGNSVRSFRQGLADGEAIEIAPDAEQKSPDES